MKYIALSHGSGGEDSWRIVEKLLVSKTPDNLKKTLNGYGLDVLDDGVALRVGSEWIVLTVDTYTVNPIFFPGGNIGSLAASGTINDLVVMGAKPVGFMDTIVVEEGFPISDLERIIDSMLEILFKHGISLVGGDFKVMPRGSLDKINITGVGIGVSKKIIIDKNIRAGDSIVVTGPIGDHGAVILAAQLGMLENASGLKSDSKPLMNILPVINEYIDYIHACRDPTRGGLAATLNEWVRGSRYTIVIDRSSIPVRDETRFFLEALGVDPLYMACEGVAVFSIDSSVAEEFVDRLHSVGEKYASIIGSVVEYSDPVYHGRVVVETEVGGRTFIKANPLNLPRIC